MKTRYDNISKAIDWLITHYAQQPSLETVAGRFGYDPVHFQKVFKDHVGVTPKQFVRYMTYTRARDLLLTGYPTLEAAYEAGLSGQGRLNDLFVAVEGMTPGAVKTRGAGIEIRYGFAPTRLGEIMLAKTDKGICWLGFQVNDSRDRSIKRMRSHWPLAGFIQDDAAVNGEVAAIDRIWRGGNAPLKLDLYGTNLQLQVWQALLKIPFGSTVDYKSIAHSIGHPRAARAVGNAVGANPVSLLIPCHRVIQASGIVNNYGWGSPRKKQILAAEAQLQGFGIDII